MRLSDFCAGPARTTRQFFFSAELVKSYIVTPLDRSLTAADRSKFGGCGSLFRELSNREVGAQRLPYKLGAGALLPFHGLLNPPDHSWR
ncbi:MAG: hypothetical protein A3J28_16365 [Acidobacteria bacterium RIFCSPLOWO2_12_FULL_60_22]|nr:MAG: hypothetical protein A3J28_16365 [Acidobacteria bacterium RIFCSPLOWO2_12_FULL_60_22]